MPFDYAPQLKSDRMAKIADRLDAHANPAFLEICTDYYMLVLVEIPLTKPSFVRSAIDSMILGQGVPLEFVAIRSGEAALARIKDGAGDIQISGLTVGTPGWMRKWRRGFDIIVNETSMVAGEIYTMDRLELTHL